MFDVSKHGPHPVDNTTINPQHRCLGHSQEGYGLSWSPTVAAQLLSGSNDSSICIWDLKEAGLEVQPLRKILNAHSGTVEDVDWHKQYDFLFAAVGDDHHVTLWDTRQPCTSPSNRVENAHNGDVHCLAFNAFSEFLLATGGADKCVSLWDLRNITERVHSFEGHDEEIMMVSWAPFSDTTFASCSADRRVNIWDVSKVGEEQSPEDAEDGPPELIFSHGGHTSRVSDCSWNANDQWVIASVEEDNSLQVWQLVCLDFPCARVPFLNPPSNTLPPLPPAPIPLERRPRPFLAMTRRQTRTTRTSRSSRRRSKRESSYLRFV